MKQYLDLLKHVNKYGDLRRNRTGIDTISYFGYQMRFEMEDGFPLLTTKKIFTKAVIHELIWFIKGDTNIKYLVDNGVRIWNEWAYESFKKSSYFKEETMDQYIELIKSDNVFAKKHGNLGPVYGKQWRDFNGVDQLKKVIDEIKNNPSSRRLIVSSWNPTEVDQMALPPCHSLYQFYVDDNKNISLQLYQRSGDIFLGIPFNIASYSLLLHIVAHMCDLNPKSFIHTIGDAHIYVNHKEQVDLQLSRKPRSLPKLIIKKKWKSIDEIKFEDFEIKGYDPHPTIAGKVAV